MGYDMYWVTQEDADIEAYQAASKRFYAAAAVRDALPNEERGKIIDVHKWDSDDLADYEGRSERYHAAQAEVNRLSKAMYEAEVHYFRLNIWGMGHCREAMFEAGMCYESGSDGEWPKLPDERDTEYEELRYGNAATSYKEVPREAWPEWALKHQQAIDDFLSSGVQERPGIAVHKLGSNDGWIVTPLECLGALEQWRKYCEGLGVDPAEHAPIMSWSDGEAPCAWWQSWLSYLAGAAEHGGFTVH